MSNNKDGSITTAPLIITDIGQLNKFRTYNVNIKGGVKLNRVHDTVCRIAYYARKITEYSISHPKVTRDHEISLGIW